MAACHAMFHSRLFQSLARMLVILSWVLMGSLALQGAALAYHQGKHLVQHVQIQENDQPGLDEGPCTQCLALHESSESPSWGIALNLFAPSVSTVVARQPVDPKSNIVRTCDARGPPAFSLFS